MAPRQPPAPQLSSGSGSLLVPPRRPVGLIMLVLIVDLGLAAAGAALLMKGLAGKQASEAKGAPPAETATERKSEALPPAAIDGIAVASTAAAADSVGAADNTATDRAATAVTSDERAATTRETVAARTASTKSGKASAGTPASAAIASKSASAADATTSVASSAGASAASKSAPSSAGASATTSAGASATTSAGASADATRVTSVPSAPQDPYPDPEREIDAAAARSKPAFVRCASDHGPAHGAIQIAFQVRSDGKIANAAAVENSTGNSELARCLVAEIASWRVSAHGGATIDMFRPFTYP